MCAGQCCINIVCRKKDLLSTYTEVVDRGPLFYGCLVYFTEDLKIISRSLAVGVSG